MRMGLRALALLAAVGCGCSSCEDTPAVPFKLSTAKRGSYTTAAGGDAGTSPGLPQAPAGSVVRAGVSFAAGTTQVELAGRALAISGGAIRAALEVDLDADGRPELLLVSQSDDGTPRLLHSRQGERGWAQPEPVAGSAPVQNCQLQAAVLEQLDGDYAVARAELDCPVMPPPGANGAAATAAQPAAAPAVLAAPGAPVAAAVPLPSAPASTAPSPPSPPSPPAPPGDALAGQRERQLWIVGLERSPRLLERVATPVPQDDQAPRVDAALQSRDLDTDGHPDLVLGLDVRGGGAPDAHFDVELWSRAGGLSLGTREPEATLIALADRAKTARKANPASAGQTAARVLALHAALCRESGAALLRIGAAQGLPCGPSLAAGRAASVQSAVLATQGRLLEAIAAYEALRQPMYRLTDNDRERARVALDARVDRGGIEFRTGPQIAAPSAPSVRRSAIAFLDEQRLLLRGQPAQSYDLASGELVPIGMPGDTVLTDPSGRYAVSAIVRSCQGYHLSIAPAARIALGVVAGPSISEPLIAPAPPPPNARCPQLTADQRKDSGGFKVLAWTPQGVLLARGQALYSLALDAAARAAEPASELAPGAKITGLPPHSGELTPDGRYLALLTPLGVAIHDRELGATRLVALPGEGGAVSDIALSPSGRRLALVRAGRVLVGVPAAPQAPPAPASAPSAPAAPGPVRP